MRPHQYVAYYRISCAKKGCSPLSLEGQAEAVRRYVQAADGKLVAEFSEIRSGLKSAGRHLREALRICQMRRATLVVASLDRLSRRMALTAALMDSDIKLAVADAPNASRLLLHVKAAFAEEEALRISRRVKAALAEARKRGTKLGGKRSLEAMRAMARLGQKEWAARTKARDMAVAPMAWKLRAEGKSFAAIAAALNVQGAPTLRRRRWHSSGVSRVLQRTAGAFPALARAAASWPDHRVVRAKARAERVAPVIWDLRVSGMSLPEIAGELNRRGIATARGRRWCREKVRTVLNRGRAALTPSLEAATETIRARRQERATAWVREAAPTAWRLRAAGLSLAKIADQLQARRIPTARGGRWHTSEVATVLQLTRAAFRDEAGAVAALGPGVWARDRRQRIAAAAPLIRRLRRRGKTLRAIAAALNDRKVPTATARGQWHCGTVLRSLRAVPRRQAG